MVSADHEALADLARRVVQSDGMSSREAAVIEAELAVLDHDLPGYGEFQTALSLYQPGGGEHLLDEEGLHRAAAELLHDLGDHTLCLHNVPLRERP